MPTCERSRQSWASDAVEHLFDSHAHLESHQFDADRQAVIACALESGVTRILSCGSDLESSQEEIVLARSHPGIYAAVGIHGHRASTAVVEGRTPLDEAVFTRLAELATQSAVVAIGEIGLDYHYDFSPRDVQRAVLRRQLQLARELDLPVILHSRESDEDLRAICDEIAATRPLRGVLHCFLSGEDMAAWALARGLYIGIAGPVTFRNVKHLPRVVRQIPLERLLVETDSPYLAPHPLRGRRNEPACVRHVAARLAEVLGLPEAEVARRTTENACRLLAIG